MYFTVPKRFTSPHFLPLGVLIIVLFFSLNGRSQSSRSQETQACFDSTLTICNDALEIYDVYPDSSRNLANAALKRSRTCGLPTVEAFALNILGVIEYVDCNFEKAETYHRLAINLLLREDTPLDTIELVSAFNGLGNIFSDLGGLESAITYYLKSLQLYEENQDSLQVALLHFNIALVLYDQENTKAAEKHLYQAAQFIQELDAPYLKGDIYGTLSSLYTETNQEDSADFFLKKSYFALNNPKNFAFQGLSKAYYFINKANFISEFEQGNGCIAYFDSARVIATEIGDEYTVSIIDFFRARNNYKAGNLQLALALTDSSYQLATENRLIMRKLEALKLKATILAELDRYKEAWHVEQEARKIRYTIRAFDIEKKLLAETIEYQQAEKNRLKTENEKFSTINEKQKADLRIRNTMVMVSILGIVLLLIYLFFMYKNFQHRNQLLFAKDRMISVLGHDIKAPFSQIESILDLAINKYISQEEYMQMMTSVRSSVASLNSTIDVVVTWSKGVIGKGSQAKEKISLLKTLDKAVLYNQKLIEESKTTVEINTEEFEIYAVPEHMELVCRNLINNAVKYSKPHSLVQVTAQKEDKNLRIDFIDQGPGLSKEQIDTILNTRDSIKTMSNSGSGIGLLLIQDILVLNKAKLQIHSEPNKGSIFSVVLPLWQK